MTENLTVDFTLKGTSALLFHADDIEAADEVQRWRKAPENKNFSVPGDDRSPPWTWRTYLYEDRGKVVWPSANIMVCLRQAAANIILKKQKTFKELSQSGLVIRSEFCEFLYNDGPPLDMAVVKALDDLPFSEAADRVKEMGFRLYCKRAKVGRAKHVRVRPRFEDWQVRGQLEVRAPEISREVLEKIFELACRQGLGDWRPGCPTPGSFGMFDAHFKEVRTRKAG
jgi:hypothetical protein